MTLDELYTQVEAVLVLQGHTVERTHITQPFVIYGDCIQYHCTHCKGAVRIYPQSIANSIFKPCAARCSTADQYTDEEVNAHAELKRTLLIALKATELKGTGINDHHER